MGPSGLIVVGSGPAGVSAAEAFRQHNNEVPVRIFTADPAPLPYARPPLSKEFLRGQTQDVSLHPARWFEERSIELVHTGEVDSMDLADRSISAGGKRYRYDALVLACGAAPAPLPVPGGERALQLRSLDDSTRLRQAAAQADSAVVVGAGFIGCEAAASLAWHGVAVSLVAPESVPQEKRLGIQAGERLRALVEQAGVRFHSGVQIQGIDDGGVRLDNGLTIRADLVLAATGVQPRSGLAEAAGLQTRDSRVVVGPDMATCAEHVWAAGDVAFAFNAAAGRPLAVEHWQDAVDQGAIAGASAAGHPAKWDAVPGFWTTIGDTTVKYHAWGDGYQHCRLVDHRDGFTAWYAADGAAVGVLTCNADEDYAAAEELIRDRRPAPVSVR